MASPPLHPLARQALVASANPACHGWAFGMTKYLAHDDPRGCVQWALNFIRPYLSDESEHGMVVTQSQQFLRDVLDNPLVADLRQMEEFVWNLWNHRSATCGGGPLARLIWAAMGVVEQATPGKAAQLRDTCIFPPEKNHLEIAEGLVWDQSATAIQMLAHDHPEVPQATAEAFTQTVCSSERPQKYEVECRMVWAWKEIFYEIATMRTPEGFYVEFKDFAVGGNVFSGPFASIDDVSDHMELLRHQPRTIQLVPREPGGTT